MFRSTVESTFRHGLRCYKNYLKLRSVARCYTATISTGCSHDFTDCGSVQIAHNKIHINKASDKEDINGMMEIWPSIVMDLTESDVRHDIPESLDWMKEALEYVVRNDHLYRGLLLMDSYRHLASPQELTDGNLKLARILAWCVEMWEAAFVLQDDIMDEAKMRKGKTIWSLHSDIGLGAINDTVLLESGLYELLRQHFKTENCYVDLVEIFHEITMKSALGQTVDLFSMIGKKPNFNRFTMDRYYACVKYKNLCITLPVVLAMYFAGIDDLQLHRQAREILNEIARLQLIQNDYLDVYGDPRITEKSATDIELGKASWVAITAWERSTPRQKKIFEECYGYADLGKLARVRDLYDELALPAAYTAYERESYNQITSQIKQLPDRLPHDLFHNYLQIVLRQDYLY